MTHNYSRAKAHFFKDLDMSHIVEPENPQEPRSRFTASKIIATIGPSTQDVKVLNEMLGAGMVGARLDLTWVRFVQTKQCRRPSPTAYPDTPTPSALSAASGAGGLPPHVPCQPPGTRHCPGLSVRHAGRSVQLDKIAHNCQRVPLPTSRAICRLQTAMRSSKRICCTMVDTLGREIMLRRPVYLDEQVSRPPAWPAAWPGL
jgi:hypothetical protein